MIDFTDFFPSRPPERRREGLDCPRELMAEHATGRSVHVFIDSPRLIGQGNFGVVYAVTARVVGMRPAPHGEAPFDQVRRGYEFPAVVKKFYDPRGAQNALSLYDVCKDAGLHVATTYRADSREGAVIMSELGGAEKFAISGSNWSVGAQALEQNKIERIANWDALLTQLFSESLVMDERHMITAGSEVARATEHGIELQPDVYFFRTPLSTTPTVEAVAGDFDVVVHPSQEPRDELLKHNVRALGTTCFQFVQRFVRPERQQEHLNALYAACAPFLQRELS